MYRKGVQKWFKPIEFDGFRRLAGTLRDLADSYIRTGERFKDRHDDLLDDD